jgi:hypothetical protein
VYVPSFIAFTVLPAEVLSVMAKSGPDVSTSFVFGVIAPPAGDGVAGGGFPTVNEPRIEPE